MDTAQNQLFHAAASGNTLRVRQLLGEPSNYLWGLFFQETQIGLPLDINARLNDQEMIRTLLWSMIPNPVLHYLGYRTSASPGGWDLYHENITPLALAVTGGHVSAVRALLERGADVDVQTQTNDTSLHLCGSLEIANILLTYNADINIKNCYQSTALHTHTYRNNTAIVCALLATHRVNIEELDAVGNTALLIAIQNVQVDTEILIALLRARANINAQSRELRMTALMYAARANNIEAVRLLLDYLPDLCIVNSDGDTVLDYNYLNPEINTLLNNYQDSQQLYVLK